VRSGEASGPFTGAALKAISCLLRAGLLDPDEEEEGEEEEEEDGDEGEEDGGRRRQSSRELQVEHRR
jgi:hypothetical protein